MLKLSKGIITIIVLLLFGLNQLNAQHGHKDADVNESENHSADSHGIREFNAGEYIVEHVSDAYDWHLTSWGRDHHISIPLPVILYSKHPELHGGKRFFVFMSSKFHHAHDPYKGFLISDSEEFDGKIVEFDSHGNELGRPIDLSITKTIAEAIISLIILIIIFVSVARKAKLSMGKAPTGLQNFLEPIIIFIRDEIAKPAIGETKYKKFMPYLLSVFFFILLNNFIGLIPFPPFGANVTGNIAVTMVLALFTLGITTINGNKHYWKEIYNPDVPWWLKFPIPMMPIIELTGVITKPFVLMVRLFANMLAGHMVVSVFISLIFIFASLMGPVAGFAISPVSVAFSVFILLLDVLVAFIQAYVFTLLSAIYFGMATEEHD